MYSFDKYLLRDISQESLNAQISIWKILNDSEPSPGRFTLSSKKSSAFLQMLRTEDANRKKEKDKLYFKSKDEIFAKFFFVQAFLKATGGFL